MNNIVLIGLKNAGKTTLGKMLAKSTDGNFLDLDELILIRYNIQQNSNNQNIIDVFKEIGEEKFRQLEKEVFFENCEQENTVFALGGGTVSTPVVATAISQMGKVIYLYQDMVEFKKRLKSSPDSYLHDADLDEIYQNRHDICQNVADIIFDVQSQSQIEIIEQIRAFNE